MTGLIHSRCIVGGDPPNIDIPAVAARHWRSTPKHLLVLGFLPLALVVAACGSNAASPSSPSSSSTTNSSSNSTVVMTASSSQFGNILVDNQGMTLYTLTNAGKAVSCSGSCASVWPPLVLSTGTAVAAGSAGVGTLGTTSADGMKIVTHTNLPLYRYSGDNAAGDANGDGINSFGGIWHVVKVGASNRASSSTPTTGPSRGY